jgi:hypothetical protein
MMLTLAAALLSPAAPAAEPDPMTASWLAEVKTGPRRYFHEIEPGKAPRRIAAYVVPGDQLVATAIKAGFTSVTFVDREGKTHSGWIESAGLSRVPGSSEVAWQGSWKARDAQLDIRLNPDRTLRIEGSATWGSHDPERVARGGINTGQFDVALTPLGGNYIAFSLADAADSETAARPYNEAPEDDARCRVTLHLLGRYLLAKDNNRCGGHNVSFTGVYRFRVLR